MNQAPVRNQDVHESGIPYLEPEASDEPKTEPRIRVQLLLAPEPSGVQRRVKQAQRFFSRLKLAPAIVLGALLGSAPYVVEQHVRARVMDDEPRIISQSPPVAVKQETSQPVAAIALPPQLAPAPLPPPSAAEGDDEISWKPRPQRFAIERALLKQGQTLLKHGDGFGAQLVLDRLTRRVPHGKLMRQRKLLEIRVLQAIGAKSAARRAASEFAKSYPQSRDLSKLSALLLGS